MLYEVITVFAAVTFGLFLLTPILGWIGVGLTVWCYYFFRDPERVTPARPGLVVSPADGVISRITSYNVCYTKLLRIARQLPDGQAHFYAATSYLDQHGRPQTPEDLATHDSYNFV